MPRTTPDPTDADAVLARVMAEQSDPAPARATAEATLAKAPDLAVSQAPVITGPDGKDVEDSVGGYLDYLSQLARQLGVPDPVEEYFAPVVGRWSDMHAEAERWRAAARTADAASAALTTPLGGLDSAWRGKDAEAFVQYMDKVGLAGNDLSDAMTGMGQALDKTADGVREIVQQLAGVLADTAETSSQAMTVPAKGDQRVREHLDHMHRPTKDLFDAVRQVLEAFVKLCDGVEGGKGFEKVAMQHAFPDENFAFSQDRVNSPKVGYADPGTHESAAGGSSGYSGGSASGGGGSSSGGGVSGGGGTPSADKPDPQPGAYVAADEKAAGAGQRPAAASAGSAPAGGGGAQGGQGGVGGMPMMGGMGGAGQGGDQEHKGRSRVVGDPTDIFGRPTKTSPSVIGDED
jgi:uncharacterized protein YukE